MTGQGTFMNALQSSHFCISKQEVVRPPYVSSECGAPSLFRRPNKSMIDRASDLIIEID